MERFRLHGEHLAADPISIAVTTYGTQSLYTHECLSAIRGWKTDRHELLVACHDASPLLEHYLRACVKDGLIDRLIETPSGYGHTKGVNRCFADARGRWLFNIANDIAIGPAMVDECARRLADPQLGLIGWHWYNDGTFWDGDRITRYQVRDEARPRLDPQDEQNIRRAPWFTGRTFVGLGAPLWLCLCNTAFFGIRREVWESVGGFSPVYEHYWADDFLNYAVLDRGLDVAAFPEVFRQDPYFREIQYAHVDVEHRRRHDDAVPLPGALEQHLSALEGGLSPSERQLLYQVARGLPDGATVLHVGLWRGAGLILFLSALARGTFIGIDGFDLPGVSDYSAQPPVARDEFLAHTSPFVRRGHLLDVITANTLDLASYPRADVIFIDGGHTRACIEHDIRLAVEAVAPGGLLIFHDYGQPRWPDVTHAIDAAFSPAQRRVHDTLCLVRT